MAHINNINNINGKPLPIVNGFHKDRTFKNYTPEDFDISATIGSGTFGRVFLAQSIKDDEYFAMKVLKIRDMLKLNQVEHVNSERRILMSCDCPFIVRCYWTYRTDSCLFLLFEYIAGGELFTYLRNRTNFNCKEALFYSSEIIVALEYMHKKEIVYRDLKPENILLDTKGHVKLTDFGFAKELHDMTWTLCGTPEYLAPEVIQNKGHNFSVDWWALGILIYEMIVGTPPFTDDSHFGTYKKILDGYITWPKKLEGTDEQDLIRKLLNSDRTGRLGGAKEDAGEVKSHVWFADVNWAEVRDRKVQPPIIPKIAHTGDTSNFDDYSDDDWAEDAPVATKSNMALFNDF